MAQTQQAETATTPTIQAIKTLGDHGEIERVEYRVTAGSRYWITDTLEKAREIAAAEGGGRNE